MKLGWNRDQDGVIAVFAHASDGRVSPVADFWLQPLVERLGVPRNDAKKMQEQFAEMLVQKHNQNGPCDTPPKSKKELAETVARRMLAKMQDSGSVESFCENMAGYPEMYLTELALAAIDCLDLSGRLSPPHLTRRTRQKGTRQ